MKTIPLDTDTLTVPGLVLRPFQGAGDLPSMLDVISASEAHDSQDNGVTLDDMSRSYSPSSSFDPFRNTIIADIGGQIVGYARVRCWSEINNGPRLHESWGCLLPEWRRRGIGRAMLGWIETRSREIAGSFSDDRSKLLRCWAGPHQIGLLNLLRQSGFQSVRQDHVMMRPTLDDIPDFPMPEGLELRPATPDQFRAIWDASREASKDHWSEVVQTEDDYRNWLADPIEMQAELWQIAWDRRTNQVAGQVRTYINPTENLKYNRRRGYTETISVGRPWRKRGLARALIALSLHRQKAAGMTESALGVDSTNTSGANRIYTDCGFQVVETLTTYQKDISR
jgi:mycothiol synthase